jgi:hypothetical protein
LSRCTFCDVSIVFPCIIVSHTCRHGRFRQDRAGYVRAVITVSVTAFDYFFLPLLATLLASASHSSRPPLFHLSNNQASASSRVPSGLSSCHSLTALRMNVRIGDGLICRTVLIALPCCQPIYKLNPWQTDIKNGRSVDVRGKVELVYALYESFVSLQHRRCVVVPLAGPHGAYSAHDCPND